MTSGGLGNSGPGGGMFNRLFDAGLDLGVNFGRQELLGIQPGANQATQLGLTGPQLLANGTPAQAAPGFGGIDQRTLLIGAVVIIAAIVLAKAS